MYVSGGGLHNGSAARYTLQIFLIISIFLFLITGVVAYFGWRGYAMRARIWPRRRATCRPQIER